MPQARQPQLSVFVRFSSTCSVFVVPAELCSATNFGELDDIVTEPHADVIAPDLQDCGAGLHKKTPRFPGAFRIRPISAEDLTCVTQRPRRRPPAEPARRS